MLLRLSQKLAQKIKTSPTQVLPPDANPFADWSAHLFTAARAHYVIRTNTASLYSALMHEAGISNDSRLLERGLGQIREVMIDDGLEFIYRQFIVPSAERVYFSKALNRSVTGSMNDLIYHAKAWLTEGDLSPHDASFKLNDIPMGAFGYAKPRELLRLLIPCPMVTETNRSWLVFEECGS